MTTVPKQPTARKKPAADDKAKPLRDVIKPIRFTKESEKLLKAEAALSGTNFSDIVRILAGEALAMRQARRAREAAENVRGARQTRPVR